MSRSTAHTAHTDASDECGEGTVGSVGVDAVEPVVEDEDLVDVGDDGIVRVFHDEGRVEAPVELQCGVGMEEVCAWVAQSEFVGEPFAGLDDGLREVVDAVHVVADGDAMPVDGGRLRKLVFQLDPQHVADSGSQFAARDRATIRPCRGSPPGQLDRGGRGNEVMPDDACAALAARLFETSDGRVTRLNECGRLAAAACKDQGSGSGASEREEAAAVHRVHGEGVREARPALTLERKARNAKFSMCDP